MRHSHIEFRRPWVRVSGEEKERLERELVEERSLLHNFAVTDCEAVARRVDTSDVLFELDPNLCECAVVHLTMSGHVEMQPGVPSFELFATFDDWVQERMIPDVESYEGTQT
jgi:hypothetical protein